MEGKGKIKSKFALSVESIPRQTNFMCLSLKYGCILTGLMVILYSVLGLAQCIAVLETMPPQMKSSDVSSVMIYGLLIAVTITHAVTLFLSTIMLVGTLRDKSHLMRPWIIWMSINLIVLMFMFIYSIIFHMLNHFADTSSIVNIAIVFLVLLVRFYTLMIVASYYKELEESKGENEKLVSLISNENWYSA